MSADVAAIVVDEHQGLAEGEPVARAILLGDLRREHASKRCQDGINMRQAASNQVVPRLVVQKSAASKCVKTV